MRERGAVIEKKSGAIGEAFLFGPIGVTEKVEIDGKLFGGGEIGGGADVESSARKEIKSCQIRKRDERTCAELVGRRRIVVIVESIHQLNGRATLRIGNPKGHTMILDQSDELKSGDLIMIWKCGFYIKGDESGGIHGLGARYATTRLVCI